MGREVAAVFKIQFRTQSMKRWSDLKPKHLFAKAETAREHAVSESMKRPIGADYRVTRDHGTGRAVFTFTCQAVEIWKREERLATEGADQENRIRELEFALRAAKYNEERLSERLDHIRREITDKLNQEWQGKVNKAWFDGADFTRRNLETQIRLLSAQLPTELERAILKAASEAQIKTYDSVPGHVFVSDTLVQAIQAYREAELAPNRQALLSTLMARMHQQLDTVYRQK